jgi:PBP1b-binding outer membrane lipoprotein LpoB
MTTATWITMLLVMAFVWGGCAYAVGKAVSKESRKRAAD